MQILSSYDLFRWTWLSIRVGCFCCLWLTISGHFLGCSSTTSSCTEGEQTSCSCPDGKLGLQSCTSGQWTVCAPCSTSTTTTPCSNPGSKQGCTCTNQQTGEQVCGNDQKWGNCQCSSTNPTGCQPGATQACACANQQTGQQTCNAQKAWDSCQCQPTGCQQGATQQCACPGSTQTGTQTCQNKIWGICGPCQATPECDPPGSTQICQCPNGGRSRQTCQPDKTWGACNCGGPVCTVGQSEPCSCSTGFSSTRTCVKDANGQEKWGECQCSCTQGQTRPCDCPHQQTGQHECLCTQSPCRWSVCKCPTCKSDSDCAKIPVAPRCDPATTQCVGCLEKAHCTDPKSPFCSPATTTCVACLQDSDCQGGTSCDPFSQSCQTLEKGSLSGNLTRCKEGVPPSAGCSGNVRKGDDQGPIYFLFFSGKNFPPRYNEKPFLVHKVDKLDFSDASKSIPYRIDNIPAGKWLVYVFLDDNNNWSPGQHMPDTGDLVAFIQGVEVKGNTTATTDFYLFDRY